MKLAEIVTWLAVGLLAGIPLGAFIHGYIQGRFGLDDE